MGNSSSRDERPDLRGWALLAAEAAEAGELGDEYGRAVALPLEVSPGLSANACLLYTSDAADDM
eukprot:9425910-Alexandrium_andersonii.AAC.1